MHPFFTNQISQIRSVCVTNHTFHKALPNIGSTIVGSWDFLKTQCFLILSSFLSFKLSALPLKDVHAKYVKTAAFCIHLTFFTRPLVCICFLVSIFHIHSYPILQLQWMGWIQIWPTAVLAGLTLQGKSSISRHFRVNMSECLKTLCSEFITFLHMSEFQQYCRVDTAAKMKNKKTKNCQIQSPKKEEKSNCVKRASRCSSF